ncbi:unnamed protein product [Prorocentrum cordatum]|uniref:Uncharacterized protein n=1 Tax=Prorocentrum cordatum TaxID=2364126 RepID=A0ABN9VVX7_9DINO|nr:unnamed protein product [Polarella glacialis]
MIEGSFSGGWQRGKEREREQEEEAGRKEGGDRSALFKTSTQPRRVGNKNRRGHGLADPPEEAALGPFPKQVQHRQKGETSGIYYTRPSIKCSTDQTIYYKKTKSGVALKGTDTTHDLITSNTCIKQALCNNNRYYT